MLRAAKAEERIFHMSSNHLYSMFDINNSSLKLYYNVIYLKTATVVSKLCIVILYIKS